MSDDDLLPEHERVRAALADVPRASAEQRDTAIARALIEFDRMHTAPNVVAFPQRRRWYSAVAAAAAVLLIGVVGVGALKSTSSNDSASSGEARSTTGAYADMAVAVPDSGLTAQSQSGGGAETAPAPTIIAITGAAEVPPQVATPDQLKTVADSSTNGTVVLPTSSLATAAMRVSFTFPCTLDANVTIVREISYQGTPAVLVRDTVTGMIQAIDAQCNVLATSQP
jgi:hypothetical protein